MLKGIYIFHKEQTRNVTLHSFHQCLPNREAKYRAITKNIYYYSCVVLICGNYVDLVVY